MHPRVHRPTFLGGDRLEASLTREIRVVTKPLVCKTSAGWAVVASRCPCVEFENSMSGPAFRIQPVNGKKLVHIRPKAPKYRVLLSIDGGGIRGIIPATVLQGFERCVKEVVREKDPDLGILKDEDLIVDVADCFDTIAGNSAGSILALYFASVGGSEELYGEGKPLGDLRRGSADGVVKAFEILGQDIFKRTLRKAIPFAPGLLWAKYGSEGMEEGLGKGFGDLTLKNLKLDTYIPALETDNSRPCAFWCRKSSPHVDLETGYTYLEYAAKEEAMPLVTESGGGVCNVFPHVKDIGPNFSYVDVDMPLRVVAQASASAPSFFPPTHYPKTSMGLEVSDGEPDKISWVDGGLVANNPLIQALFFMSRSHREHGQRFLPNEKLAVMSIGTGGTIQASKIGERSFIRWGNDLVRVLMSAHTVLNSALLDDYFFGGKREEMGKIPDRYLRINKLVEEGHPEFKVLSSMDDVSNVEKLKEIGNELVEKDKPRMKDFIEEVLMAQ